MVSPWASSVNSTAPIVSVTKSSRFWNGGRLSTMARAIAPRSPPQKMTARYALVIGSAPGNRWTSGMRP